MIGDTFMWFPAKDGGDPIVKGETTDAFFGKLKAFEVKSFQFKMENDATESKERKPKFKEFEIDKEIDSASSDLARSCTGDKPIPTVMMALRKASGSGLLYAQYMFRKVYVTGISWNGGTGQSNATEKITFSFLALGFQYFQQTSTGQTKGEGMGRSRFYWNLVNNRESIEVPDAGPTPEFLSPFTDPHQRRK